MGLAGVASDNLVVSGAGCRMFDAAPPKEFEATRPGEALPTAGFTSPALADGRLFVRLKTALACYDLRKPPAPRVLDITAEWRLVVGLLPDQP